MNQDGNNNRPAVELQVKVADGVNLNIAGDALFQGAADALIKAGKNLPNIPKLDLDNNSEDSFDKRYEERKNDQLQNNNNNMPPPQNPYNDPLQAQNPYMNQANGQNMMQNNQQQMMAPNMAPGFPPVQQLPNQFPPGAFYPPVQAGMPQQYNQIPQYEPNNEDEYFDDDVYMQFTHNQAKFYQIAYYSSYFNVSTMDILHRLRKSLWPFCSKSTLFEDEDKVDLYGPVWIMITLIVEIAIVGFINYQIDIASTVIELRGGKIPANLAYYSLQKVARAGFVCIGYFLLMPLLLLLLIKYVLWVPECKYLWLFGIYGYSFTIFLITTALNVVPIDWLRWSLLGLSGIVSLLFIWVEMYIYIKRQLNQHFAKFLAVCLVLAVTHGIFILALKKYFLA